MQVSELTSSIRRLFASLDIHYNNSLNIVIQKQIGPIQKNPKQKLSTQRFSGFFAIPFFNKHQDFLNFQ